MNRLNRVFIMPVILRALLYGDGQLILRRLLAQCPPKERLQEGIHKAFPKFKFEIIRIEPSRVKGLCQVQN